MLAAVLIFIILIYLLIKFTIDPFCQKCKCTGDLHGKVVLITGGNTGIGLETARNLAKRNAKVIIASTNVKRSEEAVKDLIKTTGNNNVEQKYLNLKSFNSTKKFVQEFNERYERLDILVHNAGCFGAENTPTEDGIDKTMQINYYGPFLLTNLLLPKLIKSQTSRIVVVSSVSQHLVTKFDFENMDGLQKGWFRNHASRYNHSKLCLILWMKALKKRLPSGVTINALHPGGVRTELFKRSPPYFKPIVWFFRTLFFITPEEGAQTSIHLCLAPELENKSGLYYAACKSNWISLLVNDDLIEKVWDKSLEMTKCEVLNVKY